MMDDTLQAEEFGLLGRFYFDGRGIAQGGYALGDYWLTEAAERCAREGYECVLDNAEPVWGTAYPMDAAAFYLGWYNEQAVGPFLRSDFRFRPGAVAYHIHSGSAAVLRSRTERWTGPLMAAGAAATMGCVSEPLLHLTPQLNVFADRLCRGMTFGEAAYLSMAVLSWQVTVVGDPLYRPFRHSADEQIERLEKAGRPEAEWAWLRKINLLVREGRFNVALELCRRKIEETGSLVLREKLADLYLRNELAGDALREYAVVIEQAATAEQAVRAGAWALRTLRVLGRAAEADQLEQKIRARWKDHPVLPWLETAKIREPEEGK